MIVSDSCGDADDEDDGGISCQMLPLLQTKDYDEEDCDSCSE